MGEQDLLATADEKQLLILSLEKANANRQVGGHDPELGVAREVAIQRIDNEDDDKIDMENKNGGDGHGDIPHADDGVISLLP